LTGRKIKLSNLLLNADLPEALQDILETRVQPFQTAADIAFDIPRLIDGEPAYKKDGSRMMEAAKQVDIVKGWARIRDRYLTQIKGFGWLIRKDRLNQFNAEVAEYEICLATWVKAFRDHVEAEEEELVDSIVSSISGRVGRSQNPDLFREVDLKEEVKSGLARMRVIEPKVRIVLKNVSWESSRDQEFNEALVNAFSKEELKGWFKEFTAARQRSPSPK